MGTVFTHDMWYWPAERMRTLHVYLPDGYEDSDERYPVMYFFDGHNLFFDERATYGKSWGLKSFLDQWEKPLIIVGMECSHEGDARLDEYCPYSRHMFGRDINAMGEQTFQWIVNDVKGWADANLRTWAHREATGIGGSSMGGLMSLYGILAHNDVFSKAACLSTGVRVWGRELKRELRQATPDPDTRIYLSWGEYEAGHDCRDGYDGNQVARAVLLLEQWSEQQHVDHVAKEVTPAGVPQNVREQAQVGEGVGQRGAVGGKQHPSEGAAANLARKRCRKAQCDKSKHCRSVDGDAQALALSLFCHGGLLATSGG